MNAPGYEYVQKLYEALNLTTAQLLEAIDAISSHSLSFISINKMNCSYIVTLCFHQIVAVHVDKNCMVNVNVW
jgi:hypothetical protein